MLKAGKTSYRNSLWAIVPCGIFCKTRGYLVDKDDLANPDWNSDGSIAYTPLHLAGKHWSDFELFAEAYEAALGIFQPKGFEKIDVSATLDKARRKIASNRLFREWHRETSPEKYGQLLRAFTPMECMEELTAFRECQPPDDTKVMLRCWHPGHRTDRTPP